jgi:hypothetical protein
MMKFKILVLGLFVLAPGLGLADQDLTQLSDKQLIQELKTEVAANKFFIGDKPIYNEFIMRGHTGDIMSGLNDICDKGTPQEKFVAVSLLGDLGSKDGVKSLALAFKNQVDENPMLFEYMAISLGQIGGNDAVSLLTQIYDRPDKYGIYHPQAMIALANLGQKQMIPEFQKDFAGNDVQKKGQAAYALAELGDRTGHDWAVAELNKPGPLSNFYGYWEIATIGATGDKADAPLIKGMIDEKETFQRYYVSLTYSAYQIAIHDNDRKTQELYFAYPLHKLCDWMVDSCLQWLGNDGGDEAINQLKWAINEPTLKSHQIAVLKQLRRNNVDVQRYTDGQGGYSYKFPQGISVQINFN